MNRHYEVRNIHAVAVEKYPYKKSNLSLAMIRARQLHRETGEIHYVYKVNEDLLYNSKVE